MSTWDDYQEPEFSIGDCACRDCATYGAWSYAHGHDDALCRFADRRAARIASAQCPRCAS